ncbi:MAG: class I SAM-dependent methyltransferase, partial [Chloroflexi bacterium]|nr:class I SAM-dependent methyltransferase [Chloroflexota bacterium]
MSARVCLVTTARHPDPSTVEEARAAASRMGGCFSPRLEKSLSALHAESGGLPVVVVETTRVACHYGGEVFFFHPSMTKMRMHDDCSGRREPLLEALNLQEGDRVLDATLGRAGDAILIAHAVGEPGAVVGLEANPIVAEITRLGLAAYSHGPRPMIAAMRRVQVCCAEHTEYLSSSPSGSFDVVYFDPMFDVPLSGSTAMDPLRPLAHTEPLST